MVREFERKTASGIPILLGILVAGVLLGVLCATRNPWLIGFSIAGFVVLFFGLIGLFTVAPNESKVLQLFGDYVGSVRTPGLRWANPFFTKKRVSTRIRNFESSKLKVNDREGSPVELAAVVVWRVVDTAEAVFEVDDYENYVHVQSESALRNLATHYPYDTNDETQFSLRGNTAEIADKIKAEVSDRLAKAGVEVIEARISHLAYAPEIANAMLRRQQASAIIAARARIVEGAVGMVQMALNELESQNVVNLDPDRRAAMVSNLLVVLCGDRDAQPVVNTGTIYQ